MGRIAAAAMAAGLAALACAAVAQGHNVKYPVDIAPFVYIEEGSLGTGSPAYFGGATRNGQIKCQAKRTVHVFSEQTGALFGTGKTDVYGDFDITASPPAPPGEYRAEVDKKVFGKPGHKHVCKPDPTPPTTTVRESSARSAFG